MEYSASDFINDVNERKKTRGIKKDYREIMRIKKKNYHDMVQFACFVSVIEPINHVQAFEDEFLILAMKHELEQFIRNDV